MQAVEFSLRFYFSWLTFLRFVQTHRQDLCVAEMSKIHLLEQNCGDLDAVGKSVMKADYEVACDDAGRFLEPFG
ncbi:MAG: hypothetical protein Aurels2KO_57490 [Aureliella sp.]